jgi:hypothetical protein
MLQGVFLHISLITFVYFQDGTAGLYPEPRDKEMYVRSQIYGVEYDELINKTYDWPPADMVRRLFVVD